MLVTIVFRQLMLTHRTPFSNVCFYLLFWIWILELYHQPILDKWQRDWDHTLGNVKWNQQCTHKSCYSAYSKEIAITSAWNDNKHLTHGCLYPVTHLPCFPVIYTQISVYFSWFTKVCNQMQTGLPARQSVKFCVMIDVLSKVLALSETP
jgi:hypothetical protein